MLWIQLILMRIRILDPHWKIIYPDPGQFFKIYWFFLTKNHFQIFLFKFLLIFILKLYEPFRNEEIFIISFLSKVQIWVLGVKNFCLQFLVDILPLGSISVDPHIFCGTGSRKPKSYGSNGSGSLALLQSVKLLF